MSQFAVWVGVIAVSACLFGCTPDQQQAAGPVELRSVVLPIDYVDLGGADGRVTVTDDNLINSEAWRALTAAPETPRVTGSAWERLDTCPRGSLHYTSLFTITTSARVYQATIRRPDGSTAGPVVVKHSNDCVHRIARGRPPKRHRLVSEALFLFRLRGTGLAPTLIHLSPPTVLPDSARMPNQVRSMFLDENRDRCIELGTETRFLVQGKAGWDLSTHLDHLRNHSDWTVVAKRAVSLTIRVVEMLEQLHEIGVIHGDIHGYNILFKHPTDNLDQIRLNDTDLVFIDFDYSILVSSAAHPTAGHSMWRSRNPRWLSPWQLAGHSMGRRDDVYRALELLTEALSEGAFHRELTGRLDAAKQLDGRSSPRSMARLKSIENMFVASVPDTVHIPVREAVQAELHHIARAHLNGYDGPDVRPEYQAIIEHLTTVDSLL